MLKPLLLLLMLAPTASLAQLAACETSISGAPVDLKYIPDDAAFSDNRSFRERMFGGRGPITCPSLITLRYLTPDLTDDQRSVFCLTYDPDQKTYTGFDLGARDAFLNCRKPSKTVCERVNQSKDAALAIAGLGGQAPGGTAGKLAAAGVAVVKDTSGAMILTGNAGYIASTLGTAGTALMSVLTAPATLSVAAVSVVAVGSAVYVCRE